MAHLAFTLKSNFKADISNKEIQIIRFAGDEFLIFSKSRKTALENRLLQIQKELCKKKFKSNGNVFTISFSFGVSIFQSGNTFLDVLKEADEAMYKNKLRDR